MRCAVCCVLMRIPPFSLMVYTGTPIGSRGYSTGRGYRCGTGRGYVVPVGYGGWIDRTRRKIFDDPGFPPLSCAAEQTMDGEALDTRTDEGRTRTCPRSEAFSRAPSEPDSSYIIQSFQV
jgi:hypothetical protein